MVFPFHQIYFTSAVTTVVSFLLIGGLLKWKASKEDHAFLLTLMLIELPMALAAFYLVRLPLLDAVVKFLAGDHVTLYGFLKNFYAPLTEEPSKLLPLLIPFFRRKITNDNFVWAAMALGLGFGIGEIWLVAGFIAHAPAFAGMPWYMFTGFLNERFMVCIIHGGFTSVALWRLGNKFVPGVLGAMLLHFLGNFLIYLAGIGFGGFSKTTWQIIIQIYIVLFFIGIIAMLAKFKYKKAEIGKFLLGSSVCPECGTKYDAPIMGVNWITKRYEKCPNCHKWHWVKRFDKD
jgi:hypothetical protein